MVVMSESALNLDTRLELEQTSGLRGPHPTSQPDVDSSALLFSFSPALLSTEQKPCEAECRSCVPKAPQTSTCRSHVLYCCTRPPGDKDLTEALPQWDGPCLRGAGPASGGRALPQWDGPCLSGAGPASVGRALPQWDGPCLSGAGPASVRPCLSGAGPASGGRARPVLPQGVLVIE
ncbi:unnamed protein product [Arctogadus glacialis]